MGDSFNRFWDQIGSFLSQLNTQQKVLIFGGLAAGLAILIVLGVWTTAPRYEVLFSQLSPQDAGKITDHLREQKVKYKLENSGATILVPDKDVYDLRLDFAQQGLPESGGVGYEIFDKNNLGMTDFVQKINYRRALEGELTRTIQQIESIEKARVHIVIPDESLFKEDQKEPTASVILKLRNGSTLGANNVRGISHLLASSVEGLSPENITIIDSRGKILSDNSKPDNLLSMTSTQLDFTQKVENYLASKAQSMLDQVMGPGNSVVRVAATLNFTKVEKTVENYDPDNTVVRSEEIKEQSSPVSAQNSSNRSSANSTSNSTVTNYEINKTVEHVVDDVGNITRLSVAVLVNNKRVKTTLEDGTTKIEYKPIPPKEMGILADLVKNAVGFNPERNDEISINNVNFQLPPNEEDLLEQKNVSPWTRYSDLIRQIFIGLVVLVAIVIMRSLFSQVRKRQEIIESELRKVEEIKQKRIAAARQARAELEGPDEIIDEEIIRASDFFKPIKTTDSLHKHIQHYVKEQPDKAAMMVKTWLVEDEKDVKA